MARLKLSSPWVLFYREIEAMFKEDPGVRVIYDEESNIVKLYVDGDEKANALAELLPTEKEFGNVTLRIEVIPSNCLGVSAVSFEKAFEGNAALSYIKTVKGIFSNNITYIVFKNKVVQYFDDSLSDVNGLCSTLYQEIAKDIFGCRDGIFFCTDVAVGEFDSLGKPLGEWP